MGATPIFRSFHRTASSTTYGWSRWNIFNVLLYMILSTTVSFLEDTILFLQGLLFFKSVWFTVSYAADRSTVSIVLGSYFP